MTGTTDMKTSLITAKPPVGFWIIATVTLFFATSFLFTERYFWKWQSEWRGGKEGRLAALYDIQNERFQYLVLDPSGDFDFTGELEEGVEIWNYAYAEQFLYTTPRRVPAEAYVSAYNELMRRHVRRLDKPPSAVEHRSAELKHEDHKVRERAAVYLGMMGAQAKEAIPHLIEATRDEIVEVRAQAAWALGKIGPGDYREEVIRALELIREIPNSKMQEIGSRALEEIDARTVEARTDVPHL